MSSSGTSAGSTPLLPTLSLRQDHMPYLTETTYPLPHIAHLSPIEIFKLNLSGEGPPRPKLQRKNSIAGCVGSRLRLRVAPRAAPRVIQAPPPELTFISIDDVAPRPVPETDVNPPVSLSDPVPRRARKTSASRTGAKRASLEYLRFSLWKGKGKYDSEGNSITADGDAEFLRNLAARALTRTDTRLSGVSEIAFAQPGGEGSRYQRSSTPHHAGLAPEAFVASARSLSATQQGDSSKLARMLGADVHGAGNRVRSIPNLRVDTHLLDVGLPGERRESTHNAIESSGLQYSFSGDAVDNSSSSDLHLVSPHTEGETPHSQTPPSTPIISHYPPPSHGRHTTQGSTENTATWAVPRVRKLSDVRDEQQPTERPPSPQPLSAPSLGQSMPPFFIPMDDGTHGMEWTGEWNHVDMREVIRKLRGLKMSLN